MQNQVMFAEELSCGYFRVHRQIRHFGNIFILNSSRICKTLFLCGAQMNPRYIIWATLVKEWNFELLGFSARQTNFILMLTSYLKFQMPKLFLCAFMP